MSCFGAKARTRMTLFAVRAVHPLISIVLSVVNITMLVLMCDSLYTVRHKNCTLLTGTITLQNYAIL